MMSSPSAGKLTHCNATWRRRCMPITEVASGWERNDAREIVRDEGRDRRRNGGGGRREGRGRKDWREAEREGRVCVRIFRPWYHYRPCV